MSKKLFVPAPPSKWKQNAVAGGSYSAPYAYIAGYYQAAEILARSALQEGKQDTLFFPACFNYRHYVELSLKHLIVTAERFYAVLDELGSAYGRLGSSAEALIINEHSLERLLRLLLERLGLVNDERFDDNVRISLIQLHNMDPDGQTFRYSYRTDGKLSLPDQGRYDLENIRTCIENVYNYLSGIDMWLHYNTDLALELLYELQQRARQLDTDSPEWPA